MSYTTNCVQNFNLILASHSPRRSALLKQAGYAFSILPADIKEEEIIKDLRIGKTSPAAAAEALSKAKAGAIQKLLMKKAAEGEVLSDSARFLTTKVLAADTLVALDDEIFGKPKNRKDAFRMLSSLSGTCHQVHTGFTVITLEEKSCGSLVEMYAVSSSVSTEVEFYLMTEDDINWYLDTGEPMDKAGSYGIQGLGARFIRRIRGDYNNVVGLPLAEVCRAFQRQATS